MLKKEQIHKDMIAAMKVHDKRRKDATSLLLAAIKQREVDERIVLDDPEVFAVIHKMIKQRQDAAALFAGAGRTDLADQENYEISVITSYLPTPFTEAEVGALIQQVITSTQAQSIKDMGKVMAELKPKLQGRVDVGLVSAKVKEYLSK